MLKHLELVVDKWPIGPQNAMHSKGDRFFLDEEAARILVGFGKAKYVDKVMTTETAEPVVRTKRKYQRRDMKARA